MSDGKAAQRLGGGLGGGNGTGRGGQSRSNRHYSTFDLRAQPRHGEIRGDTWVKNVRASVHQLRTPPAWAVDCADLDAAEQAGARYVVILDLESLATFWASIEEIRRHGFVLDRGHGKQLALCLDRWAASKAEAAIASEPVEQLSLWGGRR